MTDDPHGIRAALAAALDRVDHRPPEPTPIETRAETLGRMAQAVGPCSACGRAVDVRPEKDLAGNWFFWCVACKRRGPKRSEVGAAADAWRLKNAGLPGAPEPGPV